PDLELEESRQQAKANLAAQLVQAEQHNRVAKQVSEKATLAREAHNKADEKQTPNLAPNFAPGTKASEHSV
ncbi:MAG: hypothetical protein R3C68_12005, partial [Myxococcota bacterium]